MQKIKNIEFLRVIGCIAIVLLHLFSCLKGYDSDLFRHLRYMTSDGQKAVDLFFMLSGFFFVLTLNSKQTVLDFVKKKIIRFYPVLIFVMLLYFLVSLTGAFDFAYYDNIFCLLLLDGTSLVTKSGNVGVFWYVSAMFWVLLALFYSLKVFKKEQVNLFLAFAILFCYSFLIHAKGGKINNHLLILCFVFSVKMLRAVGGIGIGYFIGEWYKNNIEKIKNYTFNIYQKIFLSVIEFMCIYFTINNLMLHRIKFKNDMIFIITFAILIICFLLKGGFFSRLLDNDFWGKISKYTYSIYMTHTLIIFTFKGLLWKPYTDYLLGHELLNIFAPIILALILGVFTYHFVEKPCAQYFKERAKSLVAVRERERESNTSSSSKICIKE